ncbi:MAG: hypothetical protein N5P05_000287 [Chroococcopsis gigantea SAG 12.99]|jgi:MoaA/NifB/PqqE/SkfB family radical SAM enzyme|nr:hypothetical protein [Chroococcopsis gigantea SAG 12.99]
MNFQSKDHNILLGQAINHQQLGQLDEAESLYKQILNLDSNNVFARHNLGMVYLCKGYLKSALEMISPVVIPSSPSPDFFDTYKLVGITLYQNGHWEEAKFWVEKALIYAPTDPELISIWQRILPRDYLEPEVFDRYSQQTLLRYSPREASNYIYVIDIVGTCNLRCPSCPVGNFQGSGRETGIMSLELYQKILDKIARENAREHTEIWLFNWGEPLLHLGVSDIVKLTKAAGFKVQLSTNLNIEADLAAIIKAEPDFIKVSLSGFTPETYSKTHRKGDITLVKSNLYRLRYYLDKYKSNTKIWLGHHLYKNNYHQLEEVKNLCDELGFAHHPVQAFFQPLEKLVRLMQGEILTEDQDILNQLLIHPIANITNIQKHRSGNYDCELRFNQTVINHDGTVALCCGVYSPANMLGVNFLESSKVEIEKLKYNHPFCHTCRQNGCDYSVSDVMDKVPR